MNITIENKKQKAIELMNKLDIYKPYKAAIEKRNRWLAENCDLMIGYIKRESGGAYKCFSYARERGVLLINIAEQIEPRDRL